VGTGRCCLRAPTSISAKVTACLPASRIVNRAFRVESSIRRGQMSRRPWLSQQLSRTTLVIVISDTKAASRFALQQECLGAVGVEGFGIVLSVLLQKPLIMSEDIIMIQESSNPVRFMPTTAKSCTEAPCARSANAIRLLSDPFLFSDLCNAFENRDFKNLRNKIRINFH